MSRCITLAALGKGFTAPNPMVGAVIVYNNHIIGEGYHRKYGSNHAEVEALNTLSQKDKAKIKDATIYVNLEPCAHYGNTPPCADRLIAEGIKRVVVGSLDNHSLVCGRGIAKLNNAGIENTVGILEKECILLNTHFFTANEKLRPYITLKWAQDENGNFARKDYSQHWITSDKTKIYTHKLRSEHQAIWVGTNTLRYDIPTLNNRYYTGNSPVKVVVDAHESIPIHHPVFESGDIIYISTKEITQSNIQNCITSDFSLSNIMNILFEKKIISLLVEGGAMLLQSLINENLWDKAYRYSGMNTIEHEAIPAPQFPKTSSEIFYFDKDKIEVFLNPCII